MLELNGEQLSRGTITSAEARLDVSARGFWSPMDKIFTDVLGFHPHAHTNAKTNVPRMYAHHEYLKKRDNISRVIQVEKVHSSVCRVIRYATDIPVLTLHVSAIQ